MKRPNILWIYCDELRTDALGCYGNPYAEMQTPHIDSIADNGIRFDNCFCNSPVCVASRSAILTGLYPEETGVYHNEAVWPNYQFEASQNGTPPITFPSVFAQNGYTTANFGKVHVPAALRAWDHHDPDGSDMREFYQDVELAALQAILPPNAPLVIGGIYPGDRPYPPQKATDNALAWLTKATEADRPWLARVSYLQPHTPVFPPPPYDTLYADGNFPDRPRDDCTLSRFEQRFGDVIGTRAMSAHNFFLAQAHYYGLVAWIDSQVGRLLEFLHTQGILEDTIVVFGADHGASLGECGRYQKQTFAPESHRVPRLVNWPGMIAAGQVRTDISQSMDLARTLFTLTGIDAPAQFKGRDLLNDPAPDTIYATIGYGFATSRAFPNLNVGDYVDGHGWPRRTCIRTARYRLDKNVRLDGKPVRAADEDIFLADVQADPQENVNLADAPAHREIVAHLAGLVDDHVANALEVPQAWTERDQTRSQHTAEFRRALRDATTAE